ncbi:hypothetical protein HQ533_00170 [Candidatus Woesearchaeota archaeon]|nr:hypothetical protein [Candidatus Woesearchaeota archaeon]
MVKFEIVGKAEYLDCILKMGDKGRVNLPSKTAKMYDLEVGSLVELTYVRVNDVHGKSLMPFGESNYLDEQKRIQTSQNARDYLGLKQGDYFVARIRRVSNPTKSQAS